MSNNNLVHFETLWTKAEEISANQFKDIPEVLSKLSDILEDLRAFQRISIDNSSAQLAVELKNKTVGRLLFALTALSQKENIDVYAALKMELDTIKLKEKIEKAIPDFSSDELEQSS